MKPLNTLVRQSYQALMQKRCQLDSPESLERSAIVFSPHQDDETLGCGGTILKRVQAGAPIKIVFMTDGSQSHAHVIPAQELKDIRAQEAIAAAEKLGIARKDVLFLEIPDGTLAHHRGVAIQKVKQILLHTLPEDVFVPYRQDGVPDHDATCEVVLAALKDCGLGVTVYEYPVWFWCNWPWTISPAHPQQPTSTVPQNLKTGMNWLKHFRHAVDIGDVLDRKRLALEQHRSQMTRLVADPRWLTLADVAQGEFLPCFFQNYEFFYRYRLNTSQ